MAEQRFALEPVLEGEHILTGLAVGMPMLPDVRLAITVDEQFNFLVAGTDDLAGVPAFNLQYQTAEVAGQQGEIRVSPPGARLIPGGKAFG